MRYVGILPDYDSGKYTDRRYHHSEQRGGTITHFYECWAHDDETPPAFGDNLNKEKVRAIDRILRDNPDFDSPFSSTF